MKILVCQPVHENRTDQLERELQRHSDVEMILFPEGYLRSREMVEHARQLAKSYLVTIITGYKDENNKDRALIINRNGETILDRAKTPVGERLYQPSVVEDHYLTIGYLLCMEILQGVEDMVDWGKTTDFVAHPIGVGMFSEEQFEEWVEEARKIARTYRTMIIGTSHADGSFRNCGVSIPIAYCIDEEGETVFISKNDIRTRIVEIREKTVEIVEN